MISEALPVSPIRSVVGGVIAVMAGGGVGTSASQAVTDTMRKTH
jgi:hypothetical protein